MGQRHLWGPWKDPIPPTRSWGLGQVWVHGFSLRIPQLWFPPRPLDAGADAGLTQASLATHNPVLRRPPVLEDYVNVTSTGGDRAFLVLRADPVGTGVQVGAVQPRAGTWTSYAHLDSGHPSRGPPCLWSCIREGHLLSPPPPSFFSPFSPFFSTFSFTLLLRSAAIPVTPWGLWREGAPCGCGC